MPVKAKKNIKKKVTFSDDTTTTVSRSNNKAASEFIANHPPVFVRKTFRTIPWHLLLLLCYYIKISSNYNTFTLLMMLIPSQFFYLMYQFNKSTIYGNKRLKLNLTLSFITMIGSFLLSFPTVVLVILYGAPFVEHLALTWLLSLHTAFLAYPALYSVFNCDFKVGLWKKYFIAIVICGWLSCVVIPLDWDRDWQNWPIPVVVGSYLGAFVGYSLGAFI
ncbi:glycosylphosphatidylinositol anchor biosynthesis protein 11 [Monosporozyma unispora]